MEYYYRVLNVSVFASDDEVKKAYEMLASNWRPGKNLRNERLEAEFKEISKAYEVLSDPNRRRPKNSFSETRQINYQWHRRMTYGLMYPQFQTLRAPPPSAASSSSSSSAAAAAAATNHNHNRNRNRQSQSAASRLISFLGQITCFQS